MNRLPLVQLALFLVIAVVCTAYVGLTVVGADSFTTPTRVTVVMDNGGGITPRSPVTYRGVQAGEVREVRLSGRGVLVEIDIAQGQQIPADTDAVVAQDTPVAIKHLDLRPATANPPFLTDGSVITANRTAQPLPLEKLLLNLMRFADSIDTADIATIADELSAGLSGTAPELEKLVDNGTELLERFRQLRPTITNLTTNGREFLAGTTGTVGRLPELTATLSKLSGQIRAQEPAIVALADRTPKFAAELIPLLDKNHTAITTLLGNLVTTAQLIAVRTPALQHGLDAIPDGLGKLASIGHDGRAQFALVATQGTVCYFDTKRRTPTDVSPRTPSTDYHCAGGQTGGFGVRGAANAPKPPVTPTGGQSAALGASSWYMIYLRGAR